MTWEAVQPCDYLSKESSNEDIEEQVSSFKKESNIPTRARLVEELINQISDELRTAHHEKYDADKAESTAALCLEAQKELSEFLADAELMAKEKKAEVEYIESEQYFFYKSSVKEKITDVALNRMVDKDDKVLLAKKVQYQAEADFSKYKNLFGMLKDAHVYFRAIGRGKNDW